MALIKSISGIRGTIGGKPGESLSPLDVVRYTAAFGQWAISQGNNKIIIGRDGRISGPIVSQLVTQTLLSLGADVIDLGISTTPTVEFEVVAEQAAGGIIITASHNPAQWNALKLLNHLGEFISDADGKDLLAIAENQDFSFAEVHDLGEYKEDHSFLDQHIQHVLGLRGVHADQISKANFRVLVDAVKSTGGIVVPDLLHALGVKNVDVIYGEPTGHFAHNPEPLPENLGAMISKMKEGNYDLGIVVDPDVDRLCFISEDGTPFGEEYTLVAIADYILSLGKGNTVSNLSSTRALRDVTEKHGGTYFAAAVGEVNVVNQMKAQKAVIGGEGNGGVIFPESHYGRDALIGIALFLTQLSANGKTAKQLRNSYPDYFISKNKIELEGNINLPLIFDKIKLKYKSNPVNTIDGLRIEFDKDWVHLRASNTEPIIRIIAESSFETTANNIATKLIKDIQEAL